MSTSLNVEDLIDEAGFGPYQLLILLLCFLVMFLDGYDLAAVAYIVPSLMEQWGLSKPQLGQALSAALFGLAIGALLAGPLADRLGRKPALLWSVLLFGLGSLITAWADSLSVLTVYRLLTGIGLGAALPNTITLLSEYAPARHRAMLVSAMLCGFPLGAGAGGLCASWLLPLYGWPSLMLLGGIVPLLLCLLLAWKMPESVRYLVARQAATERIRRILQRISRHPSLARAQHFSLGEQQHTPANSSWREVLSQPWTMGTLLLWLCCFMSMLIYYMGVNWMPLLLKEAGLNLQQFSLISALFPIGGGVGSIVVGWLMGRHESNKVLAGTYLAAGVLAWAVGNSVGQGEKGWLLGSLVFFMGFASGGGQSALASMSASFYPTHCRATGVGSMYGVGRFGAICGVLLGAELLRQQMAPGIIFSALFWPAALITLCLMLKYRHYHRQPRLQTSQRQA